MVPTLVEERWQRRRRWLMPLSLLLALALLLGLSFDRERSVQSCPALRPHWTSTFTAHRQSGRAFQIWLDRLGGIERHSLLDLAGAAATVPGGASRPARLCRVRLPLRDRAKGRQRDLPIGVVAAQFVAASTGLVQLRPLPYRHLARASAGARAPRAGMPSNNLDFGSFVRFLLGKAGDGPRMAPDKLVGACEQAGADFGPVERSLALRRWSQPARGFGRAQQSLCP